LERKVTDNPEKKLKIWYKLEKEAETLITADVANQKYWEDCKEFLEKGKKVCTLLYFWLSYSLRSTRNKVLPAAVICFSMWSTCSRPVFTQAYDL